MFILSPIEYAPEFLVNAVKELCPEATHVAMVRRYNSEQQEKYVELRNRSEEVIAALRGMAGDLEARVVSAPYSGRVLKGLFCFDPVGAQFAHTYDLFFCVPRSPAEREVTIIENEKLKEENRILKNKLIDSGWEKEYIRDTIRSL